MKKIILIALICFLIKGVALGQYNTIKTSASFLGISPSTRSASMGDIGVASANDGSAAFWNPGKLVMVDTYSSLNISHTPWMQSLIKGMSLTSAYAYIDPTDKDAIRKQIFAASYRYFSRGDLKFVDANGNESGSYRPSDFAVDFSYSRLIEENTGLGITARFISSNMGSSQNTNDKLEIKNGIALALDLGYYKKMHIEANEDNSLSVGASILNLGSKIKYTGLGYGTFLPTTMKLGAAYNIGTDPLGTIYTFGLEFNKLLVPSTPEYDQDGNILKGKSEDVGIIGGAIQSFYDAPGGFKEELKEIQSSLGGEVALKDKFFFRGGVSIESKSKGFRNYGTIGLGYKTILVSNKVGVDVGYILPFDRLSPLKNTFRFSINIIVDK